MWLVYILKCEDGAFYTGLTKDLKRRLEEHLSSVSNKYTSHNKPEEIVHYEKYENRLDAENREKQIKKWSRLKKLALINSDFNKLQELSKSRD